MKVEILRTPGLDLIHDLAAKGVEGPVEVPKDLTEGDVKDLDDDVAEALIAVGVAKPVDDKDKGKGKAGDKGKAEDKGHPAGHAPGHAEAPKHDDKKHPPAK
jgi:hypothetical protein